MQSQNGTTHAEHRTLDAQINAVKSSVKNLIDRLEGKPDRAPRMKVFAGKVTEAIKAHPISAIAVALGLGYLVVRVARR
jgi:hypothetical protein